MIAQCRYQSIGLVRPFYFVLHDSTGDSVIQEVLILRRDVSS